MVAAHHIIFVCEEEFQPQLLDELTRMDPSGTHRALSASLVESTFNSEFEGRPWAFARQLLPEPRLISGLSISQTAEAVFEEMRAKIPEDCQAIRLHVFGEMQPSGSISSARGKLIVSALEKLWSRKQRRFARALNKDPLSLWREGEALVQLAVLGDNVWCAVTGSAERLRIGPTLSRFAGGLVICPQDKRPPARAYQKLLEAQQHLGVFIAPGERCVDLGASPGSWTYIALAQRAQVTAIDRSPLRDDLMADDKLEFLQTDAFKYQPPEPVDWLLSDIIAYPERLIELVETWVKARACRKFVVTIKFKGADSYYRLEPLKAFLQQQTKAYDLRHLHVNKNEVTAMGILD